MYDGRSLVYCDATISLYRELLDSLNDISPERRQILTESLGCSYYGRARLLLRRKDYWSAIRNLATACRVSPSIVVKEARGSLARRLFRTTGESPVSRKRFVHNRNV